MASRGSSAKDALAYCVQRPHLVRTGRIAAIVGLVLNAINESGPIADGRLGAATWARVALNFVVPFIVSNLGLLSGRAR